MVDLTWADEFIRNVRPYIFVREEDSLLIKKPNQAHRLNPQGVRVLKFLLEGGTIGQLLDQVGREEQRAADVALFLNEVRRCLDGTLQETNHTRAVEVRPLEVNFSRLPVLSEVAVTSRCNLRCAFCYGACSCTGRPANARGEMTTREIEQVLAKIIRQARVPSVSFTGGEPAIRPDLCRLVSCAKGLGLRVNLITNGTLITAAWPAAWPPPGSTRRRSSLEGVTGATHDAVTGVPGSFSSTLAGVAHLKGCGIPVHTNTTMNRRNLEDCRQMPRFVREELGLDKFSMNLVIPSGTALVHEELLVRYSEVGPMVEGILEESRRLGVEFMWYSPTPLCLFNPDPPCPGEQGLRRLRRPALRRLPGQRPPLLFLRRPGRQPAPERFRRDLGLRPRHGLPPEAAGPPAVPGVRQLPGLPRGLSAVLAPLRVRRALPAPGLPPG